MRSEILKRVSGDSGLIDLLVLLSASVNHMNEADFLRIRRAVEEGRLDSWKLRNLIQGQPIRDMPDEFVATQFRELLMAKPESAQVLFEVLWLHCHGRPEKFKTLAPLFRELLLQKGLPLLDGHFGWEWHEAAKKLIEITQDKQWLEELAKYIRDTLIEKTPWLHSDFLPAVTAELLKKAPLESWRVFSQPILEGNEAQKYIMAEFLGKMGSSFQDTSSALWALPEGQFREWVHANPEVAPRVLGSMSLYTVEEREDGSERFKWHPHALVLLEEGTNEAELADALESNLFSFGSTGSRVPYLEKRVALVQDLEASDNPRVKRIARTVGDWLKELIDDTKRRELNESARFL
jgi:hypothetical protein